MDEMKNDPKKSLRIVKTDAKDTRPMLFSVGDDSTSYKGNQSSRVFTFKSLD